MAIWWPLAAAGSPWVNTGQWRGPAWQDCTPAACRSAAEHQEKAVLPLQLMD